MFGPFEMQVGRAVRKAKVRNATAKAMKAHLRRKKEAPLAGGAGDETPLCEAPASI